MTEVVLLGPRDAPEIRKLASRLGERSVIVDTETFPEGGELSIGSEIVINGRPVTGACYFTHFLIEHPFLMAEYYELDDCSVETLFEYLEKYALLTSLLRIENTRGKLLINPPDAYYLHHIKPYQLRELDRYDIPTPRSISTTDPATATEYFGRDQVVRKPLSGHLTAELVDPATQEELQRPMYTYQEYVSGEDIRVYVLGGTVIGAYRVETRGMPEATIDYRGYESKITRVDLNSEQRCICEQVADLLEVRFCAIDCKLPPPETTKESIVVLECNPNPGFVAVEESVGTDEITETLLEYININT